MQSFLKGDFKPGGYFSRSQVVPGPLLTGPLHKATYITDMLNLAEQRGWVGNDMNWKTFKSDDR